MPDARGLPEMWQRPTSEFRSAPFWSWNSKLDPDRLCRAIEEMNRAGMGGFFMHARYGLKTPYLSEEWFKCVSACIAKAEALDMKAYLYDEDRWPSGAAGGLVTRPHKEYRQHQLVVQAVEKVQSPEPDAERLAVFNIELDADGNLKGYGTDKDPGTPMAFDIALQRTSGWHNDGSYLDTMNPEAVKEFIRVTHKAYADRYQDKFGKSMPAIFTDEPNYGHNGKDGDRILLSWTPALPQEFKKRRGYDLRDKLPELAFPSAGKFSKVCHDYRRTVTELFVEAFAQQIGTWCEKHSIALTGHWSGEDTLESQIRYVGACMPHYEFEQWPGIDILCDSAFKLQTAKQAASVADQLGRPRVLSELYGCTGWDWPLEGHKFGGDWQFASGVNFRCPHLTHYSLAGGAKRDYPASIFKHSPWWKYYGAVEDYFGRLSFMLTQGKPVRDVLVIHPVQSAWGMFYPRGGDEPNEAINALQKDYESITRTLSGEHYDWDFGDESLLAKHGQVSGANLKVGKMTYKAVVVPSAITLRGTTLALLMKFVKGGGKVLLVGRKPTMVDAVDSADLPAFISQCAATDADSFIPALEATLPRRLSITEGGKEQACLWTMMRHLTAAQAGGRTPGQLLFMQSHDRKAGHTVHFSAAGKLPVVLWDTLSGAQTTLEATENGDRVEFDLVIHPSGSALLSLGLAVKSAAKPAAAPKVVERKTIAGPLDIQLTEPNTLPLDYCQFRVSDEPFSEPVPSLKADAEIRARFGLGTRLGGEHQPWYLYAMGTVDLKPRGNCQVRRTFQVADLPRSCKLAIEMPEAFEITINGQKAGTADGWWLDDDIKTIDITKQIKTGENEVLISFNYRPDMELEDMYLVGDFGISKGDVTRLSEGKDSLKRSPENIVLTAPPTKLELGSWVGQGLDFYGAAVKYRIKVQGPGATSGAMVSRAVCGKACDSGNPGDNMLPQTTTTRKHVSDSPWRGTQRVRLSLPDIQCTAAAVHVNGKTFVLPWMPFEADITDALHAGENDVEIEVIGGRKNIMGPLHVPWEAWTSRGEFNPDNPKWIREYYLMDHGLMSPVVVETLE